MDATTMPSTSSLVETLRAEFPQFTFTAGADFQWDSTTKTIQYNTDDDHLEPRLLHELSHGLLQHSAYDKDIDLIAIERDAWKYARTELAERYAVDVDADTIQDDMDTYREWLHARSTCPKCESTGL